MQVKNAAGENPPRIGVSACLSGEAVRYDGGHKRQQWIVETLAREIELLPLCPEAGIGLGIPRPMIQLVAINGEIRVRGVAEPERDVTSALLAYADKIVREVSEVDGWILKARSPSCGLHDTPVYDTAGRQIHSASGKFAERLQQVFSVMPITTETALAQADLRDNFLERVFVYRAWRRLLRQGLTLSAMQEFHYRLRGHLWARSNDIGQRVATQLEQKEATRQEGKEYISLVMQALAIPAGRKGIGAALHRLLRESNPPVREANVIRESIDDYVAFRQKLARPVALLSKQVTAAPGAFLLYPEKAEQALRYQA